MKKERLLELAGVEQLEEWPKFPHHQPVQDDRSLAAQVYDRIRHVSGMPMTNPDGWLQLIADLQEIVLPHMTPEEKQDVDDSLRPASHRVTKRK